MIQYWTQLTPRVSLTPHRPSSYPNESLLGYGDDFHGAEEYLREFLVPRQVPSMGEYDDTQPFVIEEHLKMSRQANCRIWVAAWFGVGSREDGTLINTVFPTVEQNDPDHRIAIHYQTNSLIRKMDSNNIFQLDSETGIEEPYYWTVDGETNNPNDGVANDMLHFCNNFFKRPNYYTIGIRPVVFVYLTHTLTQSRPGIDENGNNFYWQDYELLAAIVNRMRTGALSACGVDPFIIGDHILGAYNATRDDPALGVLDAITG